MSNPGDKAYIEYLRRSYQAVDGLWFMRIENSHGYDEALRLDAEVWQIMPKIQSRKARELLGISGGTLDDLATALDFKFRADGSEEAELVKDAQGLELRVRSCPWIDILEKAGRLSVALEVCQHICDTEMKTWAKELAPGAVFTPVSKLSAGDDCCRMRFSAPAEEEPAPEC